MAVLAPMASVSVAIATEAEQAGDRRSVRAP